MTSSYLCTNFSHKRYKHFLFQSPGLSIQYGDSLNLKEKLRFFEETKFVAIKMIYLRVIFGSFSHVQLHNRPIIPQQLPRERYGRWPWKSTKHKIKEKHACRSRKFGMWKRFICIIIGVPNAQNHRF